MMFNLPDYDNPWDIGVLEERAFECNACGFSMTGLELATLGWDDRAAKEAGDTVCACPECVTEAVRTGRFNDPSIKVGRLVVPHICGVTDVHCTCAADDALDHAIDNIKEERHHAHH